MKNTVTTKINNIAEPITFKKTTIWRLIILFIVPIIIIAISIFTYLRSLRYVSTDDAYIKIGITSPSPEVSGVVQEVKVNNTDKVTKGEVILTLDPTIFKLNVQAAEANLNSVINQINNIKAGYQAETAELTMAKNDVEYYQKQYERMQGLLTTNSTSQVSFDAAKRQLDNAKQNVLNIQELLAQQLASLDNNINLATDKYTLYQKAKATLDMAELDLKHTILYAPFNGSVANLYIREGTYAAKGYPIFSIIADNDVWVEAYFKETELGKIKIGQTATLTIDSMPDYKLYARVQGITKATGSEFSILPAQNSSGNWVKVTQRIMVKLELVNNHLPIDIVPAMASGMSVNVNIDTNTNGGFKG